MNTYFSWDPFRELENLHHHLAASTTKSWAPAVDVEENESAFLFTFDLPDFSKEDINVKVEAGVLTVSGERKSDGEAKAVKRKFLRVERAVTKFGTSFSRSFGLPDDTDPDGIGAEFSNGVLRVTLPKSAKALPKRIDVKIN